jgi:hypothetical protein
VVAESHGDAADQPPGERGPVLHPNDEGEKHLCDDGMGIVKEKPGKWSDYAVHDCSDVADDCRSNDEVGSDCSDEKDGDPGQTPCSSFTPELRASISERITFDLVQLDYVFDNVDVHLGQKQLEVYCRQS